ncbi:MAG: hypothetical protein JXQ75_24230 [Phycisphaerae bacterium]|nr:hypothetical protein [Phycisphaerae bacterium]
MKNCYLAVATVLVLSAILAQAQTGAVYSLNVVGFQKVSAEPSGFTMPGMPFDASDPEINQVLGEQLHAGANWALADRVIMWDSSSQSYDNYYYRNSAKAGITNKWVYALADTTVTTDAFIRATDGFWVNAVYSSTQTIVLVGDVVDDNVVTGSVIQGFNMVSYPFSTERDINEMGLTSGVAGANWALSDHLIVWDAQAKQYINFYYRNSSKAGITNKWVNALADTVVATNIVNPGQGFWYQARSNFNWVAVRPYTL